MKDKYIQLLLAEIQKLESKVASLKENQNVSFSFFKESFKQTQEIMRLLHTLEFVQIEDMKSQMEKLVQFLSESETSKPTTSEEFEKMEEKPNKSANENVNEILEKTGGVVPMSSIATSKEIPEEEIKEGFTQLEEKGVDEKSILEEKIIPGSNEDIHSRGFIKEDSPQTSCIDPLNSTNKSLNDIQPANHTILDTTRSISLNDRFLFQRELFNNDRLAMNNIMLKMQGFNSYEECEIYLKENTDWNFNDEIVMKFLEMLKKIS